MMVQVGDVDKARAWLSQRRRQDVRSLASVLLLACHSGWRNICELIMDDLRSSQQGAVRIVAWEALQVSSYCYDVMLCEIGDENDIM